MWDELPTRTEREDGWFYDTDPGSVFNFCVPEFEAFSAIRLQPGECVEVEFRDPFTLKEST